MVNIEIDLRGYAINGKEEMLAPWTSAKEEFVEVLRESKSFTSYNPAQQDRLNNLLQQEHVGGINLSLDY